MNASYTVKRTGPPWASAGEEVRHEPVEVVGAFNRDEVRGTVSSDDLEPGARDRFCDLTRYPWRGEQVLFSHDYEGRGGDG